MLCRLAGRAVSFPNVAIKLNPIAAHMQCNIIIIIITVCNNSSACKEALFG